MKKSLLISILVVAIVSDSLSQQIALNSQYMFNDFSTNPAIAGTKNYAPLTFSFRRQWTGINEAPVTQNLLFHSHIGMNTGAGVHIYNDVTGPTRRTGINAAFSYQVNTSDATRISFGLSAALTQFNLDRNKLITELPNDNALINGSFNQLIPDFNVGMRFYGTRHFVGLSAYNLLQSKTDWFDPTTTVTSTLDRVFFLNAGYLIPVNRKFEFEPSGLLRVMPNAPFSFDINARVILNDAYWLGFSYRYQDAISVMIGADFGIIEAGYSYDIVTSNLSTYNSGSHEVFLTIKVNKGAKTNRPSWDSRNRLKTNCYQF